MYKYFFENINGFIFVSLYGFFRGQKYGFIQGGIKQFIVIIRVIDIRVFVIVIIRENFFEFVSNVLYQFVGFGVRFFLYVGLMVERFCKIRYYLIIRV